MDKKREQKSEMDLFWKHGQTFNGMGMKVNMEKVIKIKGISEWGKVLEK